MTISATFHSIQGNFNSNKHGVDKKLLIQIIIITIIIIVIVIIIILLLIIMINFRIYDVTTWEKTVTINILPSISRSKGNQIIKYGKLIEYNMRDIFLGKSYTKCGGETIPRPFSIKTKLSISLDQ